MDAAVFADCPDLLYLHLGWLSQYPKGQAFITAAYALGCSAGNFTGGQLLTFGVRAILIAGIIMALVGTVIIFSTVNKSDETLVKGLERTV